jgi:hypothetical protein
MMTIRVPLLAALLALAACQTTYDFAPVQTGDDGARDPEPRSNSQYVRALYADLLGRSPEIYDFTVTAGADQVFGFPIDEQQMLVGALDATGDPTALRALLAAGLVRSEEVALPARDEIADPAALVRDQFRRLLGREPNAYELAAFVDAWDADPAIGPHTIVRALVGSREYQSR